MELQTGGNAATMQLELYDDENQLIAKLADSERVLGSYPVENGMRVHVSPISRCVPLTIFNFR